MDLSVNKLVNAVKQKQYDEYEESFVNFIDDFEHTLTDKSGNIFSRMFKKNTFIDTGMNTIKFLTDENAYENIPILTISNSYIRIFQLLFNPQTSALIHKSALNLFLGILESFEKTKDISNLKLLSRILIDGLMVQRFFENQPPPNLNKEKNDAFVQSILFDFRNYLDKRLPSFIFWWNILCYSVFEILLLPNSQQTQLRNVIFPYKEFLIFYMLTANRNNEIINCFPNIVLRLCQKVFLENPIQFQIFLDAVEDNGIFEIFSQSSDNDPESIALFLYSLLPIIGETFVTNTSTNTLFLTAKRKFHYSIIEILKKLNNPVKQSEIFGFLALHIIENPEPFSVFAIFLFCYNCHINLPSTMHQFISKMKSNLFAVTAAFFCVLAVAFSHQLLDLPPEVDTYMKETFSNDCVTYMLALNKSPVVNTAIPLESMQLIRGIFVTTDKRPKEEVAKVIDDLFEGWEKDPNLIRLRAIFTEILISVALNVPPMFDIDAGKAFGGTLKSLLRITEKDLHPGLVATCTEVSVDIVLFRDFVHSLPPTLVAKVMTALMRTLSYKEGEVLDRCVLAACRALCCGSSIFMGMAAFLTHILWGRPERPRKEYYAAMLSISSFFRDCACKGAMDSLCVRVERVLKHFEEFTSDTASAFLNHQVPTPINGIPFTLEIDKPADNAERVIAMWLMKHRDSVSLAATVSAVVSDVARFMAPDPSLNMALLVFIGDDVIPSGICCVLGALTFIAPKLRTVCKDYVETLAMKFIHNFRKTRTPQSMFTAFDLCAAADAIDPLKSLFEFLEENSKEDEEIQTLTNLLIEHISNSERFVKPYADALTADTAVAISASSKETFHLMDEIGGIPVLVNSPIAGRAVYSVMAIEDEPLTESIKPKAVNDSQLGSEVIEEPLKGMFELLKKRIIEEGMEKLLAKPADIRSESSGLPSVSPITSIADPLSLTSMMEGRDVTHEGSIGLLSALGLLGRRHFEAPLPKDVSGINRILSAPWKERARVPVLFLSDRGDFWSTRWPETSALFQQFVSSLGAATKDGLSIQSNTWRIDTQFDIMPMLTEEVARNSGDSPVVIIWSDNSKSSVSRRDAQIIVTPLVCGLIRVKIELPGYTNDFGPLQETCCIPPAAAPTLVRTTAATLYCSIGKKTAEMLEKWKLESEEYCAIEESVFNSNTA